MKIFIPDIKTGIFKPGILLVLAFMSSNAYAAGYDAVITLPPPQEFSLPVSAMVEKVNVRAGQKIKKGDEIIVLDQAPFVVAKKHANANVVIQDSRLKEAQRDLEHHRELYDRTVLSTVDLENVEMREQRARAHLADARAQLELADYEQAHSKLVAPFDAIVTSVHVNKGQYLNNTLQPQPLVTLTRRDHYLVHVDVSAGELDRLEVGSSVKVESKDKNYSANISTISYLPTGQDGGEGSKYRITAEFFSDDKKLLLGQSATIHID